MRTLAKVALTLTSTALIGTSILSSPAMASADVQAASCRKDAVCFWTKKNFQGDKWVVPLGGGHPGQCHEVPAMLDNTASSLIVGSDAGIVAMRTKHNCKGDPSMSYAPGARVPGLGWFDNKMSSFR